VTLVHRRPPLTHGVLVQILAGPEAEDEASVGEELHGRGLLGDHCGVIPDARRGHVRREFDALGGVGDRTQHTPGVRGVPL
jgi:hypothetical protein